MHARSLKSMLAAVAALGLCCLALPAAALTLQAQGRLSAAGGGPVADGVYPVKFKIYASKDAQQPLWDETWIGLQVTGGIFSAELGTQDPLKNPLSTALFAANSELWLAVQVSIEPELSRVHLTQVPYAVRAQFADQVLGELPGAQLAAGSVGDKAVGFNYAASLSKGGAASDVACTGCIDAKELAPGVLSASNISWQQNTVADGLDLLQGLVQKLQDAFAAWKAVVQVSGKSVGLGKAPADTCGVDIASGSGICVDGQPASLVLQADSDAAMAKLAKQGQLVLRTDSGQLYLYVGKTWKKLQFTAVCGDQSVDPPETCDDGNNIDTDSCAKCQKAVCGDTFIQAGVEQCDDGNTDSTDACVACKKAACGDGFIQAGVETCEAGKLGTATCASVVGAGATGNLGCAADCKSYDTTACVGPVGSKSNPAATCKAILTALPGSPSGPYWLKSGADVFAVYCDMTTGGGGWTLAVSWNYSTVPSQWGSFLQAAADPKPGVKYHTPFVAMFPQPAEFRMVYANGQVVAASISAPWEKSSGMGVRAKLSNGNYLIFEHQGCGTGVDTPTGYGICMVNGSYSDGYTCDGNSGQVSGSGMFNACSGDENGCSNSAWVMSGGVQVCGAKELVAVYFR